MVPATRSLHLPLKSSVTITRYESLEKFFKKSEDFSSINSIKWSKPVVYGNSSAQPGS